MKLIATKKKLLLSTVKLQTESNYIKGKESNEKVLFAKQRKKISDMLSTGKYILL